MVMDKDCLQLVSKLAKENGEINVHTSLAWQLESTIS